MRVWGQWLGPITVLPSPMSCAYCGQYDSAASRKVLFFRLNYIFRPGDNVFLVFNQTTQPTALRRDQRDRAVMLKATYAIDF